MKYVIVIGIVVLFIEASSISSAINFDSNVENKSIEMMKQSYISKIYNGNAIYVGGSGPNNYTNIQDAIDNSSEGDTIFVYNGTYYELVRINVMGLKIIGEGMDVTFIDCNSTNKAVEIFKNHVVVNGFTILSKKYCIYINGKRDYITISDNDLSNSEFGVYFASGKDYNYNIIQNNVFHSNSCGIYLVGGMGPPGSAFNIIRNNTFINNIDGMVITGDFNEILNNKFWYSKNCGTNLYCEESSIIGNHFEKNKIGLKLVRSHDNLISKNNFIKNIVHATFYDENSFQDNEWDKNYWSNSLGSFFGFKLIFGINPTKIPRIWQPRPYETLYRWILWVNLDFYPALKPYDI